MALAIRVPVDALERERDAVRRVGAGLVNERERRVQRLHARLERMALRVDRPVVQVLLRVVLVEVDRTHTHDPAVHGVDSGEVRTVAERTKRHVLVDGLVSCLHTPPLSPPYLPLVPQDVAARCRAHSGSYRLKATRDDMRARRPDERSELQSGKGVMTRAPISLSSNIGSAAEPKNKRTIVLPLVFVDEDELCFSVKEINVLLCSMV